MIKLILKSKTKINQTLEDVYDFETEQTFKGKDYVIYDSALDTAPRELELTTFKKNEDAFCVEIFVKHQNVEYPIHESWIKGIKINNTVYEFNHTKPFLQSENIKTTTPNKFFNISTNTMILNDHSCVNCGASIDTPNEFHLCDSCQEDLVKVNPHSYKPTPSFIGKSPNKKFYGIELEYGFNSKKEALKVMAKHSREVYLKADSSISGGQFRAEVVSHPHTFEELMAEKSFLNTVATTSVEASESNGCHVHISRTAFKDKKHYAMFYFLLYSSQDLLEHIATRKLNNYCPFRPIGKVFSKDNAPISMDRYNVINEGNEATIEVRIFNSTTDLNSLKTYIQFLDSLIEYTRPAAKRVTLKDYFKYVAKHITTYPQLNTAVTAFKQDIQNVVVYKEPKEITLPFSKLRVKDLPNILQIVLKGGTSFTVQGDTSHFNFHKSTTCLEFRGVRPSGGSGTYTINTSEIAEIKVYR